MAAGYSGSETIEDKWIFDNELAVYIDIYNRYRSVDVMVISYHAKSYYWYRRFIKENACT